MEVAALYSSPDDIDEALSAGAQTLAERIGGFALIYACGIDEQAPGAWGGFASKRDAAVAGSALNEFRARLLKAERPLRTEAPSGPEALWASAAGGVYGFPLRVDGPIRGVVIAGCPGAWPRAETRRVESTLRQLALILDHYSSTLTGRPAPLPTSAPAAVAPPKEGEPSEDLLQLSEQLFAQDIELIKRDEQIQNAEQLKQDLVEKLSSELREPLAQIGEQLISLLASEHENLSDCGRQSMRAALDQTQELSRVLQNMLELWRLKQNLARVELRDVNLNEVVDEAFFNLAERCPQGVSIERHVPKLPRVRTDLAKLSTILFQLLDNAVKFTRRGSIEFDLSVEDGQLFCVIGDTGVGIAADDRSHVFEEFFQVDPSDTRGAGLGLTIAQQLVSQLGGALSFTSEVGQGSRFTFTLPVGASR